MATGNSLSISGLRVQLWRKQLFADVRDILFMQKFMGASERDMIQELNDAKKGAGSTINYGLGMKLSGSGITGDGELEGNEESMLDYSTSIAIDQLREAIRLTGKMDEKKNAYDMRMSAKSRLEDWWAERIDHEVIDKLCGLTTSTFANTPTVAAASRSIFAGGQASVGAITAAMKMDTTVLDAAKQMAVLAAPRIRPLRVEGGKEYFVAILHPYDMTNLRQDPVWNQAQREANVRGEDNPIFSGAAGIYNGIVLHEHEYVSRLNDGSSSYVARNIFAGQQAGVIAWGSPVDWVEKTFNYGNQVGFAVGAIFGCQKPVFNSVDYGMITMFCASAAATTA